MCVCVCVCGVCELSSRNFQAQLQLSSSDEPGGPVASAHRKPLASILFSRTAILMVEEPFCVRTPVGVAKTVQPL